MKSRKTKSQLKQHTELLIKDLGVERACEVTERSKVTLGRYYSSRKEHADRMIPINIVADLEAVASLPRLTLELAEMSGRSLELGEASPCTTSTWQKLDVKVCAELADRLSRQFQMLNQLDKVPKTQSVAFGRDCRKLQKALARVERHLASEFVRRRRAT